MGIPIGIPMGIPVGMGWVWELKCHPHGSPEKWRCLQVAYCKGLVLIQKKLKEGTLTK